MDKIEPKLKRMPKSLANRIRIAILCEPTGMCTDSNKNDNRGNNDGDSNSNTAAHEKVKPNTKDTLFSPLADQELATLATLPSSLMQRIIDTEPIFRIYEMNQHRKMMTKKKSSKNDMGAGSANDDDDGDDDNGPVSDKAEYKLSAAQEAKKWKQQLQEQEQQQQRQSDQKTNQPQEQKNVATTMPAQSSRAPTLADAKSRSQPPQHKATFSFSYEPADDFPELPFDPALLYFDAGAISELVATGELRSVLVIKYDDITSGDAVRVKIDASYLTVKGILTLVGNEVIGLGSYGFVLPAKRAATSADIQDVVVKIGHIPPTEYALASEASKFGFGLPVYEHGVLPILYTNQPEWGENVTFIVMAKADMDLQKAHFSGQLASWPPKTISRMVDQLSRHFAVMRELGFRHNDCKPDNILLQVRGDDVRVYISDFTTAYLDSMQLEDDFDLSKHIGWLDFVPRPDEPDYQNKRNFFDMAALLAALCTDNYRDDLVTPLLRNWLRMFDTHKYLINYYKSAEEDPMMVNVHPGEFLSWFTDFKLEHVTALLKERKSSSDEETPKKESKRAEPQKGRKRKRKEERATKKKKGKKKKVREVDD
jgi:sRNA-binding protein